MADEKKLPQRLSSELFKGLPVRVETWVKSYLNFKTIMSVVVGGGLLFAGKSIVEGEIFDFWHTKVRPWFAVIYPNWTVTNGLLSVLCLGWLFAAIGLTVLILIYGADRRRLGQLESVGKENASREIQINELNTKLGELSTRLGEYENLQEELGHRRKEAKLLDLLRHIDSELFLLLTYNNFGEVEIRNFISSVLRRICAIFENCNVRACIYTPDPNDHDLLTIRWDSGVGAISTWVNKWYIGSSSQAVGDRKRGIPGAVWLKSKGRINAHVREDADFVDPHLPPRDILPYESTLHALIHPDDAQKQMGVLSLDSKDYTFTEHDLELITQASTRIGWFMICLENVSNNGTKTG